MAGRHARLILLAIALLLPAAREACARQVTPTIVNTRGLDFGRFAARTGGTVTITPAGVRSKTGTVILVSSPTAGQATFNLSRSSGNPKKTVPVITLPANNTIKLTSGANTMSVNNFVSSPASIASINAGQTVVLSVGATLTVGANQPKGTYTGSFPVIFNYQ